MAFADTVKFINAKFPNMLADMKATSGLVEHPHISTGSFVVDYVTGIGGIPRGKITELHGLQSSGKSTIAEQTAAECQQLGEGVFYVDYEHALEPNYSEMLGVKFDPALWAINQPASAEEGLRLAEVFMQKGGCGLVIFDSVAAMVPQSELEGELGDTQLGSQARLMSAALRRLKHTIKQTNTAAIFINQLRDVVDISWVGQQKSKRLGKQYTTPGGNALKFYADLRLEFIPTGQEKIDSVNAFSDKEEKVVIGQRSRVTAVKNKCAAPFRSAEIYLRHGKGVDSTVPCVDCAVKFGLVTGGGKGGYYRVPAPYCDDIALEQQVQGQENLYSYFEQRPDKLNKLFEVVWQTMMSGKEI